MRLVYQVHGAKHLIRAQRVEPVQLKNGETVCRDRVRFDEPHIEKGSRASMAEFMSGPARAKFTPYTDKVQARVEIGDSSRFFFKGAFLEGVRMMSPEDERELANIEAQQIELEAKRRNLISASFGRGSKISENKASETFEHIQHANGEVTL